LAHWVIASLKKVRVLNGDRLPATTAYQGELVLG
jgi:hypothetical protein